jgi:hypothetical protein
MDQTPFMRGLLKIVIFTTTVFLVVSLLVFKPSQTKAQGNDNTQDTIILKKHSPTKAAIYSTILPGLGQAYNKKYWKIPIVYAGFTVFIYFIITNNQEFQKYNDAYRYVATGDTTYTDNELVFKYSEEQLRDSKDFYKRNMELSIILGSIWYILQIVDASVDAHFFEYDISDDLSIRLDPLIEPKPHYNAFNGNYGGLRITLNF